MTDRTQEGICCPYAGYRGHHSVWCKSRKSQEPDPMEEQAKWITGKPITGLVNGATYKVNITASEDQMTATARLERLPIRQLIEALEKLEKEDPEAIICATAEGYYWHEDPELFVPPRKEPRTEHLYSISHSNQTP